MITFACDRCKQPFTPVVSDKSDLPDGIRMYGKFHLCVNCAGKLKDFIEQPQLWHKSDE